MLPTTRFDFTAAVPPVPPGRPVHFIAIGGSGMSGVARMYLESGHPVSGSDAADSPALRDLRAAGASVHVGHAADQVPPEATVVVSSAVREDNPELHVARGRGQVVLHRAQAIAALLPGRTPVAIAGANGKSTTSAMLTAALRAAGVDTGYVIGAPLADTGVSAAIGTEPAFVVEADESDSSFLTYHPQVAVVTNIRPDHLDHYRDLATIEEAFAAFVASLRPGGTLIACADDDGARRLAEASRGRGLTVLTYGVAADADVVIEHHPSGGFGGTARVLVGPEGRAVELSVPMPGQHNILNATAAYLAATQGLGVADADAVLTGLAAYPGAHRRFQLIGRPQLPGRGEAPPVTVIDDYAHNPDKVAAVVNAGRAVLTQQEGRLVVVFQPHLYSRTRDFAGQFAAALAGADVVVVVDVYGAREDPIPGVSGALITDLLNPPDFAGEAHFHADFATVADLLAPMLRPGDVVLTVGAGDITRLGPEFVSLLTSMGSSPQAGV